MSFGYPCLSRLVLRGDSNEGDFWDRVKASDTLELVMFALPKLNPSLEALGGLREASFNGEVAVIVRYADEVQALEAPRIEFCYACHK